MIENPVKSPIVPPIAESMSTNLAELSLVILSKTGVSKMILTNFSFFLFISKELQTELKTHGTKIDGAQFFMQLQKEDND